MARVRKDGPVFHLREVLPGDDARIPGGGDEDIAEGRRLIHCHDIEPVHVRFERPPGVDLGHDDAGTETPGLACKPPAAVAVPRDDEPLSGDEDVRRYHDGCKCALPGAVDVIEEMLHRGIVDGDNREFERPVPCHGAEPVDAGRRLLAPADDRIENVLPLGVDAIDQVHTVVDGDRRTGIEHPIDGRVVFLDARTPTGIRMNPIPSVERRRDIVLGRERVAPRDMHPGTARRQGLDQHRSLCLDMQGHADGHARERFFLDKPLPNRRKDRHILPRPRDFEISRFH